MADHATDAARWIAEHPDGMALFERFALAMAARKRRFGINLLRERVRWEAAFAWSQADDAFKVNNNHSPYIARALIARHPHLADYIDTRATRTAP
jgi:hypothetical protein